VTLITIFEEMVALGEKTKDTEFTPTEFTRFLRSLVGNSDTKVNTTRDSNVDLDQVVVGGIYDPHEDESGNTSITIFVTYHPDQKTIKIADLDWHQLCVDLIECTGHEFVHQGQYRARRFDIGPHLFVSGSEDEGTQLDQNYLGNPDEIEAYGYSIAIEIYLKYRPKKITSALVERTAMYKTYLNAFGIRHSVVEQLDQFIVKYYLQLAALPV